jgi:hypothetical protein
MMFTLLHFPFVLFSFMKTSICALRLDQKMYFGYGNAFLVVDVLLKLMLLLNLKLGTNVGTMDSKEIPFMGVCHVVHLVDLHIGGHLVVCYGTLDII